MSDKVPVESIAFWRERIFKSIATGKMLHQIILDDSYDLWQYIQSETSGHLKRHIGRNGLKVLDAGCGYGALLCCFQMANIEVDYVGVDISPDLLELARYRYPGREFLLCDIRKLPYPDKHFDWGITRSVAGMISDQVGPGDWDEMYAEISRVSKNTMSLEYPHGTFDQPVFCTINSGALDSTRVGKRS